MGTNRTPTTYSGRMFLPSITFAMAALFMLACNSNRPADHTDESNEEESEWIILFDVTSLDLCLSFVCVCFFICFCKI